MQSRPGALQSIDHLYNSFIVEIVIIVIIIIKCFIHCKTKFQHHNHTFGGKSGVSLLLNNCKPFRQSRHPPPHHQHEQKLIQQNRYRHHDQCETYIIRLI